MVYTPGKTNIKERTQQVCESIRRTTIFTNSEKRKTIFDTLQYQTLTLLHQGERKIVIQIQ